jgi:hypothetical protein
MAELDLKILNKKRLQAEVSNYSIKYFCSSTNRKLCGRKYHGKQKLFQCYDVFACEDCLYNIEAMQIQTA